MYRDAEGTIANVTPGLVFLLGQRLGLKVSPEDLLAYIAGTIAHPGYTNRFRAKLRQPGVHVPLTAEPELWTEAAAIGRQIIWLHTYGGRYVDNVAGRPQGLSALVERHGPSPDLSSGLMAGAERQLAPFVDAILASECDNGPAVGPGGRGFRKSRGCPSWVAGAVHAGQGACGSASMRCHAAVIASAHGQVAWIFRRRRRPPRTRRAAACSTR